MRPTLALISLPPTLALLSLPPYFPGKAQVKYNLLISQPPYFAHSRDTLLCACMEAVTVYISCREKMQALLGFFAETSGHRPCQI